MGLSLIPVLLLTGNVTLSAVVNSQATCTSECALAWSRLLHFHHRRICGTNRCLRPARSGVGAHHRLHTRYSAMKSLFVFIAEYPT